MASKLSEIETNIVHICNKVSADTISKYNELKVEFDNFKFNQTITNIQLGDACVDRRRGLRENHILMMKMAILLEGRLLDKNDQERLENHYEFKKDDIMKDIESYFTNKMSLDMRFLYPDPSSVSERLINEKIQANKKFNNNINIKKDIRNNYETETNNYNKKCKRNQFVKLKLLPILKTNVFELYVHRQVKTVLQIVKR